MDVCKFTGTMPRPEDGIDANAHAAAPGEPGLSAPWFDYDLAFSRNIGWLSDLEQARLREKRVAIAGMGGVGGVHMLTLARLGVGRFHVSDMDRFELGNFNRQIGAFQHTLGQPKVDSVVAMAKEINPELDVKIFGEGVNEANLDAFLDGVDVYIDGLDFFVLDIRRKLFARARQKGIPCITAGPLGFGSGYIVFTPDGMSVEDYFRFEGKTEQQQYVNFLMGLTPSLLHLRYLKDGSRVDMPNKKGPSTAIACMICAGVAACEAVKLMIGRGPVRAAPHYHHFDPYLGRFLVRKLRWGNNGPIQKLKTAFVAWIASSFSRGARPREVELEPGTPVLTRILEAARWAPSPDNSQPWRFEELGETRVRVHVDLERENPYSYRNSEPLWLSHGMLLQALRLAASIHGWGMDWQLAGTPERPVLDVTFDPAAGVPVDPLAYYLKARTVDRGAYRMKPLTMADKAALEAALGPGLSVHWIESLGERWRLSWVNARATAIRLRSQRCHAVHQQVIDWTHRFSRTGMPAGALGMDRLGQRVMKFVLADWERMKLSASLGAGLYAGLEMDVIPSVCSGGFAVIRRTGASGDPRTPEERLRVGERLLRFWIEANRRGLSFQPSLAAVFCSAQGREEGPGRGLEPALRPAAARVAEDYARVTGIDPLDVVFQARLGVSRARADAPRSIRKLLTDLKTQPDARL